MILVKPKFEIIEQENTLEGAIKHIEKAARTCYKSEHLITDESAQRMYDRLVESKHLAMLEHGTVYLIARTEVDLDCSIGDCFYNPLGKYTINPYSQVEMKDMFYFVTTNMRVIIENGWEDDLKYRCEPTDYHNRRVTVKFVTDQGILREFTRHRVFSFAVESTRYCNYNKGKFGNQVTFVIPSWCNNIEEGEHFIEPMSNQITMNPIERMFLDTLANAESGYKYLINMGWKPEEARNVLPLATKCEVVMTGFVSDWKHFFDLRAKGTTGKPHPQAEELAVPLMREFINRGLING